MNADLPVEHCPNCGTESFYQLSDQRLMCRQCRKKITPRMGTFRLPKSVQEVIINLFWDEVPTQAAADQLNLNRKTVQRYYQHMRQYLCVLSAKRLAQLYEIKGNVEHHAEETEFYAILAGGQVAVVSKSRLSEILRINPETVVNFKIYRRLNKEDAARAHVFLRKIKQTNPDDTKQTIRFSRFLEKRISQLKTITPTNFYPYLKEIEYRFNCADKDQAVTILKGIIDENSAQRHPRRKT